MNESAARDILASLRGELEESRRVTIEAQKRTAAIEKLVEGYIELFPGLADEAGEPLQDSVTIVLGEPRPKGQEAVLRIMQEPGNRGTYWTVAALTRELEKRGWSPDSDNPAAAVRTAVMRVEQSNPKVIKGRGATGTNVYYYMGDGADAPRFSGPPLKLSPGGVDAGRLRGQHEEVASG